MCEPEMFVIVVSKVVITHGGSGDDDCCCLSCGWGETTSELRQPTGLLFILRMMHVYGIPAE
jgi:hypothetical protein